MEDQYLANALRSLIVKTGLSITEFSQMCNFKPDTVNGYVNCKNEPRLGRLRTMRRVLSQLLGRKVEWKELLG